MNHSEDDKGKSEAIAALRDYLDGLAPGPVKDSGCLETLLAPPLELSGTAEHGLAPAGPSSSTGPSISATELHLLEVAAIVRSGPRNPDWM